MNPPTTPTAEQKKIVEKLLRKIDWSHTSSQHDVIMFEAAIAQALSSERMAGRVEQWHSDHVVIQALVEAHPDCLHCSGTKTDALKALEKVKPE